jgi:hypothetical protein
VEKFLSDNAREFRLTIVSEALGEMNKEEILRVSYFLQSNRMVEKRIIIF